MTDEKEKLYKEITKKVDRYSHDAFFHYLLTRHNDIRKSFCQWMIPDCKLVETTVINGEYYPTYKEGKRLVLDVLAKDENGNMYNMEMQCYDIKQDEIARFQLYAYRALSDEMKKGMSYSEVKPFRQMIINNAKSLEGFSDYIHHFTINDEKTRKQLPYSLYEIYLIQPQYLDMENIEIEEFDEFMYLFKNDRVYDKIEVHKNVQEAIAMHEEYLDSRERIAAIEREREEMIRRSREIRMTKRETSVQERETSVQERETSVQERESSVQERESSVQERESSVQERETEVQKAEDRLKANFIRLCETLIGVLSQTTVDKITLLNIEQVNELMKKVFDIKTEEDLLKLLK